MSGADEQAAQALAVLRALADLAASGKRLTIAPDWGFGSATLIYDDGSHEHVGDDGADDRFAAFVSGLHAALCAAGGES